MHEDFFHSRKKENISILNSVPLIELLENFQSH